MCLRSSCAFEFFCFWKHPDEIWEWKSDSFYNLEWGRMNCLKTKQIFRIWTPHTVIRSSSAKFGIMLLEGFCKSPLELKEFKEASTPTLRFVCSKPRWQLRYSTEEFYLKRHTGYFQKKTLSSFFQKKSYRVTFWNKEILRMAWIRVFCLYNY